MKNRMKMYLSKSLVKVIIFLLKTITMNLPYYHLLSQKELTFCLQQ